MVRLLALPKETHEVFLGEVGHPTSFCRGDLPTYDYSDRPSCSQCLRARYNEKCVYEEKPVPNTTLALNKRIRELEDEITLLETVPPHAKSKSSAAPKIPKPLPVPRSLHSASMSLNFTEASRRTKVPDIPTDWVDGEPPEHVRQRL